MLGIDAGDPARSDDAIDHDCGLGARRLDQRRCVRRDRVRVGQRVLPTSRGRALRQAYCRRARRSGSSCRDRRPQLDQLRPVQAGSAKTPSAKLRRDCVRDRGRCNGARGNSVLGLGSVSTIGSSFRITSYLATRLTKDREAAAPEHKLQASSNPIRRQRSSRVLRGGSRQRRESLLRLRSRRALGPTCGPLHGGVHFEGQQVISRSGNGELPLGDPGAITVTGVAGALRPPGAVRYPSARRGDGRGHRGASTAVRRPSEAVLHARGP